MHAITTSAPRGWRSHVVQAPAMWNIMTMRPSGPSCLVAWSYAASPCSDQSKPSIGRAVPPRPRWIGTVVMSIVMANILVAAAAS